MRNIQYLISSIRRSISNIQYLVSNLRFIILFLTFLGLFLDIFIFEFTSDLVMLFLTGLWVLSIWLYEYEGRVSIGMGLGFLILCPLLLIFDADAIAEKVAIWAYMFLVVGVIQQIVEYRRSEE